MKKIAVLMILLLLLLSAACSRTPAATPTAAPAPTETPAPTDAPEGTASPGSLIPAETPAPENATPGSISGSGSQSGHATPANLNPEEPVLEDSYWTGVSYDTSYYGLVEFDQSGQTVNLRLMKDGKGIFRSDFWSLYGEENGPVTWSDNDGELTVTCRDGTLLTGGPKDGKLVLRYRDGTLTLEKGNTAPRGEDLGTELMKGAWALESIELEGSASTAAEAGIRAWLRTDGSTADLYWKSENEKQSFFEEDMLVSVLWDSLYPGCPNEYWHGDLTASGAVYRNYTFAVTKPDQLELLITSYDCSENEYGEVNASVLSCIFVPTDGDKVEVMTAPAPATVSTVEEMMDAIGDRATVLLEPGTYNVTEWLNAKAANDLEYWAAVTFPFYAQGFYNSGYALDVELTVVGFRDLTIASADPEHPALIVCEPRYANVITFYNCKNLVLRDLIMGHTPEPGFCTGAVLNLAYCESPLVSDCELYGCGTYGITADSTYGITIARTEIRDCTYGCFDFLYVTDAFVTDSSFHDCEGYTMFCLAGSMVDFTGCDFRNLAADFLYLDEYAWASFEDCSFDKDILEALQNSPYKGDHLSFDPDANSAPKG